MSRALTPEPLDSLLEPDPFDWMVEEPELDLIYTTRRVDPGDPKTGSEWKLMNRVNGEPRELTRIQKHYAAAGLRLCAYHLSHHPDKATNSERALYEAREAKWQMRLALDYFIGMLRALVKFQGLDQAAKLLDMPKLSVEALYNAPSAHAPNVLAEIGAFNVSRKERKKVERALVPLAYLRIADDRIGDRVARIRNRKAKLEISDNRAVG